MSALGSPDSLLLAPSGYEIERSLRFDDGSDAFLERTPSSAGNRKKFTWSGWVKRSHLGEAQILFTAAPASHATDSAIGYLYFNGSDQIDFFNYWSSAVRGQITTNAVFRDVSAWYHIVLRVDTTDSTPDDRFRLYVNGTEQTSFSARTNPAPDLELYFNSTVEHKIGEEAVRDRYNFDGYMAEVNFVDGTALDASDFGETDTETGAWIPKKYSGSYGTNGFYLNFSDNSSKAALGTDSSGNGNTWTVSTNFSVTAGAGNDSLEDTPTNNWCTLNPLFNNGTEGPGTLSNGSLDHAADDNYATCPGTFSVRKGKWYWEVKVISISGNSNSYGIIRGTNPAENTYVGYDTNGNVFGFGWQSVGYMYGAAGTGTTSGSVLSPNPGTFTTNDVLGFASDIENGNLYFYKNGTLAYTITGINDYDWFPAVSSYNGGSVECNFGQRAFDYTPPTGYEALNTANLPEPTIKNGTEYFNTVLYTGNGSSGQDITTVGFQPDFVWFKKRSGGTARSHQVYDSVRGATKYLHTDGTDQEGTFSDSLDAFLSNGFSLAGGNDGSNGSTYPYVAWNWKAGGSGTLNEAGSIDSTVSANADAGFSIVSYTGDGNPGATIGHGLGVAPDLVIVKGRNFVQSWSVYHSANTSAPETDYLVLNAPNATADNAGFWNDTAPSSTVVTIGNHARVNSLDKTFIAYCFAEVEGYSKFGTYEGNTSSNGPFIHTGFSVSWLMVKNIDYDGTNSDWVIHDNKRNPYNVADNHLEANTSNTENGDGRPIDVDFLSNGFKIKTNGSYYENNNTNTYIYMAVAETPFKYANAR